MKIGIITVYDTLNSGGFLQAFALKQVLENEGHEVYHIKTGARNRLLMFLKHIHGDIRKRKFSIPDYIFYCRNIWNFRNNNKMFNLCSLDDEKYKGLHLVILGSDEIWNLSRKVFLRYPIFWGKGIEKPRIAYAASMNNATLEDLQRAKYPLAEIQKYSAVMVRDLHTQKAVQEIYHNGEIEIVADPTFLLEKKDYQKIQIHPKEKKYIMIYSCGQGIGKKELLAIKGVAAKEKLKVISVGSYVKGCDKNVSATPFEFLGYMDHAEYVITDTFHGTAFSIIYEKQFVSYGISKKSAEILRQFQLEDRRIGKEEDLAKLLHDKIDYENINENKYAFCEKSSSLLKQAIKNENGNF